MYDKSKKTWSQRLKITKNAENANETITSNTNTTTATAAANTNNNSYNLLLQQQQQHYQLQQQQQLQNTMHLPLSEYPNAGSGVGVNMGAGIDWGPPSALARSMKYAEPWIYGTVRGIPTQHPSTYHHLYQQAAAQYHQHHHHPHAAAIFAAQPVSPGVAGGMAAREALAVVICSCPEYLNGTTKRDVKKASICKKCKGSRLPLAAIGGTMRLPPPPPGPALMLANGKMRGAAATMRVVSSSKKMRPSILDPQRDPYDLMRRTRLLSPEPTLPAAAAFSATAAKERRTSRGKSASPTRGRTRTRAPLPPTSSAAAASVPATASLRKLLSTDSNSSADGWLVESSDDTAPASPSPSASPASPLGGSTSNAGRRSILRCNVNPYDLISVRNTNGATSTNTNTNANSNHQGTAANIANATITASVSPTSPNGRRISAAGVKKSTSVRRRNSLLLLSAPNEFMPPNDDDFNVEDAALHDEAPPFATTISYSGPATVSNTRKKVSINQKATQLAQRATKAATRRGSNASNTSAPPKKPTATSRAVSGTTGCGNGSMEDGGAGNVDDDGTGVSDETGDDVSDEMKLNYKNVQAIAGKRISLGETKTTTTKSLIKQSEEGRTYESFSIDANAGTGGNPDSNGSHELPYKTDAQRRRSAMATTSSTATASTTPTGKRQSPSMAQPKRPPRLRRQESMDVSDDAAVQLQLSSNAGGANSPTSVTVLTVTPTQHIKSILKRPSSRTNENSDDGDVSTGTGATSATNSSSKSDKTSTPPATSAATASASQTPSSTAAAEAGELPAIAPNGMSQFYIPMPQARKKVQFMVDEKVAMQSNVKTNVGVSVQHPNHTHCIANVNVGGNGGGNGDVHVDAVALDDDSNGEAVAADDSALAKANTKATNYEYYNRKRALHHQQHQQQQQKHQQQQQQLHSHKTATNPTGTETADTATTTTPTSTPAATAASLAQASVLAKLQQDSVMVSTALNAIANNSTSNNNNIKTTPHSVHHDNDCNHDDSDCEDDDGNCNANNIDDNDDGDGDGDSFYDANDDGMPMTNAHELPEHMTLYEDIGNAVDNVAVRQQQQPQQKYESSAYEGAANAASGNITTTTTTTSTIVKSTSDYDDIAKQQQQQQQQQQHQRQLEAFVATNDSGNNNNINNNINSNRKMNKNKTQQEQTNTNTNNHQNRNSNLATAATVAGAGAGATTRYGVSDVRGVGGVGSGALTQSRPTIRRSHSERQTSAYTKQTNAGNADTAAFKPYANNNNSNSNKNNNGSKDTMALRIKSNHNDARELFERSRPKEPPPPPPSPLSPPTTTTTAGPSPSQSPSPPLSQSPIPPPPTSPTSPLSPLVSEATALATASSSAHSTPAAVGEVFVVADAAVAAADADADDGGAAEQRQEQWECINATAADATNATTMPLLSPMGSDATRVLQRHQQQQQQPQQQQQQQHVGDVVVAAAMDKDKHTVAQPLATAVAATNTNTHTHSNNTSNSRTTNASASVSATACAKPPSAVLATANGERGSLKLALNGLGEQQQHNNNAITPTTTTTTATTNSSSSSPNNISTTITTNNNNSNNMAGTSCQEINGANLNDSKMMPEEEMFMQKQQQQQQRAENTTNRIQVTTPTSTSTAATRATAMTMTMAMATPASKRCDYNTNKPLNGQQQQQQQRTVVRVAPFNKTAPSLTPSMSSTASTPQTPPTPSSNIGAAIPEVHRLKINHTDDYSNHQQRVQHHHQLQLQHHHQHHQRLHSSGASTGNGSFLYNANGLTNTMVDMDDDSWKKTSILINGDDCYSTMNLSCDASTPIYQSSVVVTDYTSTSTTTDHNVIGSGDGGCGGGNGIGIGNASSMGRESVRMTTNANTVTINVSCPRNAEEELIYQHNKINTLLSRHSTAAIAKSPLSRRAIIPIGGAGGGVGVNSSTEISLQRSASSTSSASTSSMTSTSSCGSGGSAGGTHGHIAGSMAKRGRTLIRLDFDKDQMTQQEQQQHLVLPLKANSNSSCTSKSEQQQQQQQQQQLATTSADEARRKAVLARHEEELLKILRNPVEAVKRNLVPHICGRNETNTDKPSKRGGVHSSSQLQSQTPPSSALVKPTAGGDAAGAVVNVRVELESPEATLLRKPASVHSAPPAYTAKAAAGERHSFIATLLEDPMLSQVAEGLETEVVAELIENSLKRLQATRNSIDMSGTKDSDDMNRLIAISLQRIREERQLAVANPHSNSNASPNPNPNPNLLMLPPRDEDRLSNRGSISSATSFASATNNYELFDFDANNESDCYQSCSSEITTPGDDDTSSLNAATTRSKFYQMLVDATLAEIEMTAGLDDGELELNGIGGCSGDGDGDGQGDGVEHHHYESIRHGSDPIYEEITDRPPPLPLSAPPLHGGVGGGGVGSADSEGELDKKLTRSIFEGASKYDILSYLVDAKERGVVRDDIFDYGPGSNPIIIEEEASDTLSDLGKRKPKKDMLLLLSARLSTLSDSSEDNQSSMSSLSPLPPLPPVPMSVPSSTASLLPARTAATHCSSGSSDIERNDSGVGSETSKSSRSRYQHQPQSQLQQQQQPNIAAGNALCHKVSGGGAGCVTGVSVVGGRPLHLCEDCDIAVDTQLSDAGVVYAPLVCRKCGKKRIERKEILTEIVETEEKYGRDLQIILEEFYHPMLVAGLLTQEQLSAIFLNTEELLENNQTLAERMRDALDIALEQGDDDLLTVNIGRIFIESTQMLHAFERYCVRQAGASLLLANLEKEKELLRIFLKVSQMENAVLRRMNLNSFLMVPVQRVTKYPLLLARLYKVTPGQLDGRDQLKQAQEKIELHLNHINQEAKDVPTKLWRRISSSSPNRRASCEVDMINIKLRKMAIDVLEWNHDEVRFVMEGKLLYTQPTDNNWKKARTIKLTPVNALLVTNGKPNGNYKAEKVTMPDKLNFPKHTGVREASLLVVKEKCGRYTLLREPLYLDRCIVCSEADWDDYFEVQEIATKDTFIFKAEDAVRTKQWYSQLQHNAQGMGAWRKRRNALANIMINGMLARS